MEDVFSREQHPRLATLRYRLLTVETLGRAKAMHAVVYTALSINRSI
jgi:hypothetical protein